MGSNKFSWNSGSSYLSLKLMDVLSILCCLPFRGVSTRCRCQTWIHLHRIGRIFYIYHPPPAINQFVHMQFAHAMNIHDFDRSIPIQWFTQESIWRHNTITIAWNWTLATGFGSLDWDYLIACRRTAGGEIFLRISTAKTNLMFSFVDNNAYERHRASGRGE